jgi:hypothetical protein
MDVIKLTHEEEALLAGIDFLVVTQIAPSQLLGC